MSNVNEIFPEPELLVETTVPTISDRILNLDEIIKDKPEQFIQSCLKISELAVHASVDDKPYLKKVPKTAIRHLNQFIKSNDLNSAEFDDESKDAIYDHPLMQTGILKIQKYRTPRHALTRGNRMEHIKDAELEKLKEDLSVFKLFLYAKRVKAWQAATLIEKSDSL